MEQYKNISGNSGVSAYECGVDYIDVKFISSERIYRYSYLSAGAENIEHMKALAINGKGLSTFISKTVRNLFEK